jgi:alpha-ketoglutarate-dependent taurine dioxygenase
MSVKFRKITPNIGAEVITTATGMLEEGAAEEILAGLEAYGVLVFPEIFASDEQMVSLSNSLGEMEKAKVTADSSQASKLGVYRVSKEDKDIAQAEYVAGNDYWHMDGTSYSIPGKATLLKCEQPPSAGGETEFANLYAAYDALDEATKEKIDSLNVFHSMASAMRFVNTQPSDEDRARWHRIFPPTKQPLVWRQPNGRCSMIIGNTAESVADMSEAEGRKLLDELLAWSTGSEFTYLHTWKKGDLVIFNNPSLLHRSRPYTKDSGRALHRATVKGSVATR